MNELTTQPSLTNLESLKEFSKELKGFVVGQKLYSNIKGKNFVQVEGWQFAGGALGMNAVIDSCVRLERKDEIAYEAWSFVYSGDRIVTKGYAMCSNKEKGKESFDEYAIASMAQTRAIGKSYRGLLGWLMKMAGYEGTTAEEMDESYIQDGPDRGTDLPAYCIDCGIKMDPYVKGPKKGQFHCKGKNAMPGKTPACPPQEMQEDDKRILAEIESTPSEGIYPEDKIPVIKNK
jgi:hypothetical protein